MGGVEHREIPGFGFTFDEESGYVVETHTKIKVGHTAQMPHNWTRVLKGDTFTNAVNRVVKDYRDDVEYLENILDVVYDNQHEAISSQREAISVLQQALEKEKADHEATCASLDALISRVEVLQNGQTAERMQFDGPKHEQQQKCTCLFF